MAKYSKFAAMIVTSTIVMFGLTYLNTYAVNHVFFSETRAYMALLMGATMSAIMLAFMLGMYPNKSANAAIFVGRPWPYSPARCGWFAARRRSIRSLG